jgi:tRNA modification GTPase
LHAHGGPVVMDMLLGESLRHGARLARPGEFTERAYLNDKLDLAQAEAIADLIDSGSQQAARAAMRSLQGEFSNHAHALTKQLIEARMHVEAAIDFPEEEIDFLVDTELRERLEKLQIVLDQTLARARQGALLRDGMTVVIAGRPNAGKSSLLNALAGHEAAIVTPIAGTTRDVLRECIAIEGMPLHIIDTAGLRETQDLVEVEGIKRAHREIAKADRVLYVVDSGSPLTAKELQADLATLPTDTPVTLIYNKLDLAKQEPPLKNIATLRLSALTGEGLPQLRSHLRECMGLQESSTTTFTARRRHIEALTRAREHAAAAVELLTQRKAGELVAEELRLAQHQIGQLTGEFTADDLLGEIFASFCIGK